MNSNLEVVRFRVRLVFGVSKTGLDLGLELALRLRLGLWLYLFDVRVERIRVRAGVRVIRLGLELGGLIGDKEERPNMKTKKLFFYR